MHDQAEDLRQLVRRRAAPAVADSTRPRLVCVAGGKGGVGATTIAVNLAGGLARHGPRTVLVDADPRGGDARMLCHLEPRHTIADVLAGRCTVDDALQTARGGFGVLPGAWAQGDLSDVAAEAQKRLIEQLHGLGRRADFVVVDAGNGLGSFTRRFWQAADLVVLVTTPELTSVMDAYASVKVLAAGNGSIHVRPLVNMVSGANDAAGVYARLSRACLRFLGIRLGEGAYVPNDSRAAEAGRSGVPFVLAEPACRAARQLRRLAEGVINKPNKTGQFDSTCTLRSPIAVKTVKWSRAVGL